jgi:hypothetical protein
MTIVSAFSDGVLSAIVWPTYVGAVKVNGDEPMYDYYYKRGQIDWEYNRGVIEGYARIMVPAGEWSHVIYCRNQFEPGFIIAAKLEHPIMLKTPDFIDLFGISESDVTLSSSVNLME